MAEARTRSDSLTPEFVVRVSPLLHQAILALFDDRNTPERTALLIKLAMLELHRAEDSTTFIPLPHEPRCRRAADIVLADPTGAHEIETLAREVGTSARTLSRLFSSETQLSFKSWCQRARIAAAIEKLSTDANVSVKQLASDLGYASVPAFSHAFRQVTGKTPTEFAEKRMNAAHDPSSCIRETLIPEWMDPGHTSDDAVLMVSPAMQRGMQFRTICLIVIGIA